MATIYVNRHPDGWITVSDDQGHWWKYLYCSKAEELRLFKSRFNYRYKRGVDIVETGSGWLEQDDV